MAVGPRHVDILRTENLEDIGVPTLLDKVLIRDDTDGEIKGVVTDSLVRDELEAMVFLLMGA